MASTYSTNLAIELIGTGDQAGSWGNTTNTNLGTLIEQAISGYVTQAVSTGTDTTITIPNGATGVARNMYIELTGTGGTNTNLIVPANKKLYFIFNNTSSGQVTVKVSGQTGVSVPNKAKMILVSNGTDIVDATNYIGNISAASANITVLTSASATITNLLATTLTVSGVGIFPAGSAASAAITTTGDTNTGIFFPAADTIAFAEGGVEAMRIDSSGNLCVGSSSPGNAGVINVSVGNPGTTVGGLQLWSTTSSTHYVQFGDGASSSDPYRGAVGYSHTDDALLFLTATTEKARITSSGNLGLGVTPTNNTLGKSIQNGQASAWVSETGTNRFWLGTNWYYNSGDKYIGTGHATLYSQQTGQHLWLTSASGTAGNTITFTQALTLNANGALVLQGGDTAASGTGITFPATQSASSNAVFKQS